MNSTPGTGFKLWIVEDETIKARIQFQARTVKLSKYIATLEALKVGETWG